MTTHGDSSSVAAVELPRPQFSNDDGAQPSSDCQTRVDLATSTMGGTVVDIDNAALADLGSSATSDQLGNDMHVDSMTFDASEGHTNANADNKINSETLKPSADAKANSGY